MWCAACQQDVPALQGTGRNESRCCIRCRQPFHRTHHVQHADKDAFADSQSPFKAKALPEGIRADTPWDWQAERQLESDLRSAAILVRSLGISRVPQIGGKAGKLASGERARSCPEEMWDGDADRFAIGTDPMKCDDSRGHNQCSQESLQAAAISLPARVLLAIGIMIFVCGGSLMIGSIVSGRQDLRSVGLPLVVAGQGVLLLALRLQFNGLARSHHAAAGELTRLSRLTDQIDGHDESASQAESALASAHTASVRLGAVPRVSPARSFTFHPAGEPSPHRVIADFKSQLDDLAAKIDRFES